MSSQVPCSVQLRLRRTLLVFVIAAVTVICILKQSNVIPTSLTSRMVQVSLQHEISLQDNVSLLGNVMTVNSSVVREKVIVTSCPEPSEEHHCLCYQSQPEVKGERCAMTITLLSRLGNNMGEYASLYSLARLNKRPAFIINEMAKKLRQYFKITLPVLSETVEKSIKWKEIKIHDYMEAKYNHFEGDFIKLKGTPYSWKFYSHVAEEIRREFTFQDEITDRAQETLRRIKKDRVSVTFVGVHVRRGDYVIELKGRLKGVVANEGFFVQATGRFRRSYPDAVFVVVSDDMDWCREHISNQNNDVFFIGNNNQSSPIDDLAILANCNHTIFTIGSFGYWGAFLAGGDVIYLANYTLPKSPLNPHLHFETLFWPHWYPIAANLSDFGHT